MKPSEIPRYIAHVRQDEHGRNVAFQSNEEHSRGVAELARIFADGFGMGDWGYVLGLLHDKGKEKHEFQEYIRDMCGIPGHKAWTQSGKAHAYVGALVARQRFGRFASNFFCNQIASHHTGLHDYCELEDILSKPIPKEVNSRQNIPELSKPSIDIASHMQHFHHLSRMLFSCLVDADYLDTERFMDAQMSHLRGCHTTMPSLLQKLQAFILSLQTKAQDTPVNRIRRQVQECCVKASQGERGFYSLTVPTGGGKTLSSVLWALNHAVKNGQKRIIIAIPYTSIIVQTAAILKDIFGEENVLEHHSNFDPEVIRNTEHKRRAKLASENWDYPIVVTTNVQLFESMYSQRPSDCRKLHNISNSVIILDEVQTLPTDFLQPIVDALKAYQQLFGVSVLFTTASQPILTGRIEGCNEKASFPAIEYIQEIIPPDMRLHDKLRRVSLSVDDSGKTYDEVAEMLSRHDRVLCIVNTRRDAKELYERLPKEGITLHLSRMMCPKHIRDTIEGIKSALRDESNQVIRVIATQLVEAGVDIDFPVVYRQEAGLDSILQAAGRCNREGRLSDAVTHVFSLSAEHSLPCGAISSANEARKALVAVDDWFAPETMTSYFGQLYCRCHTFDRQKMKDLLYDYKAILFEEASKKFKLISDDSCNLIINWENSLELVERLKKEGFSYPLMKKLSQYTVSVYSRDFGILKGFGAVEEVMDGIFVVSDRSQYDKDIGLHTGNHWMDEILLI